MTKEIYYVELLKLAHEKLGSQSDMIAELDKLLRDIEHSVRNENELLEMQKNQDIRDLEQQALACDWIYTKLPDYSSVNLSVITARRLELITQANTLRGKSEQIQSKSR
jgi:hypothetical protein